MESELKRLQLLTRRMTCKDLDGLSFTELVLLERHLRDVLLIVKDQKKKVQLEENESLRKQKKEAEDEDDGMRREAMVPLKFSGSSSGERQDDETPRPSKLKIEFERRNAESMEMEFERLWLLKERMNAREIDCMNSAELDLLENRIKLGLMHLHEKKFAPTREQIARKQ